MKKIMFNDKFGLTQAVLDGRKTQTRRVVPQHVIDQYSELEDPTIIDDAQYDVGDIVAISMNYKCAGIAPEHKIYNPRTKQYDDACRTPTWLG